MMRISCCFSHPEDRPDGFWRPSGRRSVALGVSAFSLVEMVVVIAILSALISVGLGLMGGSGAASRRASTELLEGLIDMARNSAIATRSCVILAVADPGDLPVTDERCRLGLFKPEGFPENPDEPVRCVQLGRWRMLDSGIALIGGGVEGMGNPMDDRKIRIEYGGEKSLSVMVHAIAFDARGSLQYPVGSSPIVMRVAEGGYRGGKAVPYRRGNDRAIAENRLKIGRVIARSIRMN